jgi:hypothetical protein
MSWCSAGGGSGRLGSSWCGDDYPAGQARGRTGARGHRCGHVGGWRFARSAAIRWCGLLRRADSARRGTGRGDWPCDSRVRGARPVRPAGVAVSCAADHPGAGGSPGPPALRGGAPAHASLHRAGRPAARAHASCRCVFLVAMSPPAGSMSRVASRSRESCVRNSSAGPQSPDGRPPPKVRGRRFLRSGPKRCPDR